MSLHGHIHFSGNGLIYAGLLRRRSHRRGQARLLSGLPEPIGDRPAQPGDGDSAQCSDRNGDAITRAILQPPRRHARSDQPGERERHLQPVHRLHRHRPLLVPRDRGRAPGPPAAIDLTVRQAEPKGIRGVSLSYALLGVQRSHGAHQARAQEGAARLHRARGLHVRGPPLRRQARAVQQEARPRTVNLAKRFVGVDLKVGSRITVTVTKGASSAPPKVVTIRARRRRSRLAVPEPGLEEAPQALLKNFLHSRASTGVMSRHGEGRASPHGAAMVVAIASRLGGAGLRLSSPDDTIQGAGTDQRGIRPAAAGPAPSQILRTPPCWGAGVVTEPGRSASRPRYDHRSARVPRRRLLDGGLSKRACDPCCRHCAGVPSSPSRHQHDHHLPAEGGVRRRRAADRHAPGTPSCRQQPGRGSTGA